MTKRMRSNLMLLITAFLWGSTFVAQKAGTVVGPLTYNGVRSVIGALVLLPVIVILRRRKERAAGAFVTAEGGDAVEGGAAAEAVQRAAGDVSGVNISNRGKLLLGGVLCGLALFTASMLQQTGISYTTAGKAGFITALYAVLVPVLSVLIGRKIRPLIWLCVAIGVAGLYLLCMEPGKWSLQSGDLMMLGCAVVFAVHILIIDHFAPQVEPVEMACIQFAVVGVLGCIGMLIWEKPSPELVLSNWLPIAYAGVLSSGVAYTLQMVALKHADPTEASLIMCLEAVFSVLTGALVLHESMTGRAAAGCLLIFAAVVLSQLPERKRGSSPASL